MSNLASAVLEGIMRKCCTAKGELGLVYIADKVVSEDAQ
jgi:hypothetical protein